jgi:hypothetical protein
MNLVDNIVAEIFFNLQNGRPKNGRRSTGISNRERTIVVVFGLEDSCEKRIFVISDIIDSMGEETFITV